MMLRVIGPRNKRVVLTSSSGSAFRGVSAGERLQPEYRPSESTRIKTIRIAQPDAEYLSRIRPAIDKMIPAIRCQENDSLKNRSPISAIKAAPPAKTIGTADKGPPFWNSRKNIIVPMPTHKPVKSEYITPEPVPFWSHLPKSQSIAR